MSSGQSARVLLHNEARQIKQLLVNCELIVNCKKDSTCELQVIRLRLQLELQTRLLSQLSLLRAAVLVSAPSVTASAPNGPLTTTPIPTPTPHASQPHACEPEDKWTTERECECEREGVSRAREMHMQLDGEDTLQGELLAIEPADDEPAASTSLPIFAPTAEGPDAAESDASASGVKSVRPSSRP